MQISESEVSATLGMQGYSHDRRLTDGPYAGKHLAVMPMLFTCGLWIVDADQPYTRWCYETAHECLHAYSHWNGVGDPPGNWIIQKPEQRGGPGMKANPSY